MRGSLSLYLKLSDGDSCAPKSDYDGHAYFGAYTFTGGGAVYKVSTGNSNGPSPSTPMVEINRLTFSSGIYDGVVRKSLVVLMFPSRIADGDHDAAHFTYTYG